jgi:hypothetical protein
MNDENISEDSDEDEEAMYAQEEPEAVAFTADVTLYPSQLVIGNQYLPRAYMGQITTVKSGPNKKESKKAKSAKRAKKWCQS